MPQSTEEYHKVLKLPKKWFSIRSQYHKVPRSTKKYQKGFTDGSLLGSTGCLPISDADVVFSVLDHDAGGDGGEGACN